MRLPGWKKTPGRHLVTEWSALHPLPVRIVAEFSPRMRAKPEGFLKQTLTGET
jgi:hypothetical protein